MVSECTLRLLMHLGPLVKFDASCESELAGLVWSSRKPMPSAGGHGVVSSHYRNCLRVADAPAQSSLAGPAPTPDHPSLAVETAASSRWTSHRLDSQLENQTFDATRGRAFPSVEEDAGHSALAMELPLPAAASSEPAARPLPQHVSAHGTLTSSGPATSWWSVSAWQSTRRESEGHMERFLRLRGFMSAKESNSATGESAGFATASAGVVSEPGALAISPALETTFVLRLFTPSPAILPTFFAGIFVLEIGGALDIYDGIGNVYASPESDAALALLALFFFVGLARFVLSNLQSWNRKGYCTRCEKGSRACRWRTGPRSRDNIVLLLSWTVVIAALTVQVWFRGGRWWWGVFVLSVNTVNKTLPCL